MSEVLADAVPLLGHLLERRRDVGRLGIVDEVRCGCGASARSRRRGSAARREGASGIVARHVETAAHSATRRGSGPARRSERSAMASPSSPRLAPIRRQQARAGSRRGAPRSAARDSKRCRVSQARRSGHGRCCCRRNRRRRLRSAGSGSMASDGRVHELAAVAVRQEMEDAASGRDVGCGSE